MKFEFECEGGRTHWIVRCVEKGRLVEMHRFFRSPDKFLYHRGNHGQQEVAAYNALTEHLEKHPELTAVLPDLQPGEHSTMHVRQIAAGGSKRGGDAGKEE